MKDFLEHITWGRFDKNDFKHLGLSIVVFGAVIGVLLLPIPLKWRSLIITGIILAFWEYCQYRFKSAKFDVKDIVVGLLFGFTICLIIP